MTIDSNPAVMRSGWRVPTWAAGANVSEALVRKMLRNKQLPSVRIGGARVISISPEAYIRQCAERERKRLK
jgi:hypothetical protein